MKPKTLREQYDEIHHAQALVRLAQGEICNAQMLMFWPADSETLKAANMTAPRYLIDALQPYNTQMHHLGDELGYILEDIEQAACKNGWDAAPLTEFWKKAD